MIHQEQKRDVAAAGRGLAPPPADPATGRAAGPQRPHPRLPATRQGQVAPRADGESRVDHRTGSLAGDARL